MGIVLSAYRMHAESKARSGDETYLRQVNATRPYNFFVRPLQFEQFSRAMTLPNLPIDLASAVWKLDERESSTIARRHTSPEHMQVAQHVGNTTLSRVITDGVLQDWEQEEPKPSALIRYHTKQEYVKTTQTTEHAAFSGVVINRAPNDHVSENSSSYWNAGFWYASSLCAFVVFLFVVY